MNAVGVDPVEEELGGQLLGAQDGLDKDEHRGSEGALCDEGAQGEQLVVLLADELQTLRDRLRRCVPVRWSAMSSDSREEGRTCAR